MARLYNINELILKLQELKEVTGDDATVFIRTRDDEYAINSISLEADNDDSIFIELESSQDLTQDCDRCIYYLKDVNLCNGFTYTCECVDKFCPMYETVDMIQMREKLRNDNCPTLKI